MTDLPFARSSSRLRLPEELRRTRPEEVTVDIATYRDGFAG